MSAQPRPRFPTLHGTTAVLALVAAAGAAATRAGDAPVLAVVACDGYADVKSQLGWLGSQIGNPTLAGFAESFLMLATQGKGLAGLDVHRPLGIVVAAEGDQPVVHGFIPVKDLGKLLDSVQGMTGPAESDGDVRRLALPSGAEVEIVERDAWAVIAPRGSPAAGDDAAVIEPLVADHSLAIQLFPGRMPAGMRAQLRMLLDQAARAAAAQGQEMDPAALAAALDGLEEMESLLVGVNLDEAEDRLVVEVRGVMEPGSAAAGVWSEAAKVSPTISLPPAAAGGDATVRARHAQAVPATARAAVQAGLDQALPDAGDDPISAAVFGLVKDLVPAMLDTGAIDTAVALDTSGVDDSAPLPRLTVGMRVRDGVGLQKRLKERLSAPGAVPQNVQVRFDTGVAGDATLHEVAVDLAGMPGGDKLGGRAVVTLAVTPDHAFIMLGDDTEKRLAAALAGAGKPVAGAEPLTDVDVSVAGLISYAATLARIFQPDDPQTAALEAAAGQVRDTDGTQLQFRVRPLDRGVALRLSADAGAIRSIAASMAAQQQPVRPSDRPAAAPDARRDAPALAP